jgi:hypothetical protein
LIKLGYQSLCEESREFKWWSKKLWWIKALPNFILFMWLILKNKVLTWEALQKRSKVGPGIYLLCQRSEETTSHLFHGCDFMHHV